MTLENRDILQVNATVIMGLLILLSLSSFVESGEKNSINRTPQEAASFLIIPFSLSALVIIMGSFSTTLEQKEIRGVRIYHKSSLALMLVGFLWIFILFFQVFLESL